MNYSILYISFMVLFLSACVKGKDCVQHNRSFIKIENKTNKELYLEFIDSWNKTYNVKLAPFELSDKMMVLEYNEVHEGGFQKGGAPSDASCEQEPSEVWTNSFLTDKDFGTIKSCWDNENFKTIIIETSETCPEGTYQQKKAGRF